MGRRKRDRTGENVEAVFKLLLLGMVLLAFGIGGVKGFPQVFGALASLLFLVSIVAAVVLVLGGLGIHLFRSRHARDATAAVFSVRTNASPQSPAPPLPLSEIGASPLVADTFSHELLDAIEWKRFEQVAAAYFQRLGFRTESADIGPDGGVDIRLFRPDEPGAVGIVQCKAWNTYAVGVKPIRELYGVMAADGVPHGVFLTTSTFTAEARAFAVGKSLELIDAGLFLGQIRRLPAEVQTSLLEIATSGDYTTPTCPGCGIKMVERTAGKGLEPRSKFWGCRNYPRCHRTFPLRKGKIGDTRPLTPTGR
jgi:restriction system protein